MWRPRLQVRREERRETIAGFLTLFGFVASHTMLETARDALFLAKVPATHLPWVFIGIAVIAFALGRQTRLSGTGRHALVAWTAGAGVVTCGFWFVLEPLGEAGVYALYIWSGLIATLVVVHFWTMLGGIFSLAQAKRLYGIIGAGSVVGALAGSGSATLLARVTSADHLVLVAGLGFLATAALPLVFRARVEPVVDREDGIVASARFVARHGYAAKVAILMISATVCVTLAEFVFKSTVAESVPAAELGAYFGTVAFLVNAMSLVVQLLVVNTVVRRLGVSGALAVLPVLLVFGGGGMLVFGGLVSALAIKGADGSLRYSLHRTAAELVFLPLADKERRRAKAFVDIVGQRGGQAIASVAILVLSAVTAPPELLAFLLVMLAGFWASTAIALRKPYLELFRNKLRRRLSLDDDQLDLSVASLETLVHALDSENDNAVLAALAVLDREHRTRMIPALILYHPSELVVERALEIFTHAKRTNVVPVIDRLVDHPSARVRAATLAARSVLDPDARPLLMRLSFEESPEVRAAITVNLIASGEIIGSDATTRVDALLAHGSNTTKIALADAIGRRAASGFSDVLVTLAKSPELDVRLAALRAIGQVKPLEALPMVIEMLGREPTRRGAQQVLLEVGAMGYAALVASIDDTALPQTCRLRIPHTLEQFDNVAIADVLLEWLVRERDGMVRYHILRSLERVTKRVPSLVLDRALLDKTIDATVSRAYRNLDSRLIMLAGAAEHATPGHRALVMLLQDKEDNAIERLFGLIGLAYRTDDFAEIYRNLWSTKRDLRAASVELVEVLVDEPLSSAVLGLVEDLPDADRLGAAGRYHTPLGLDYESLLARMLASTSQSVRELTVFHIGELGLVQFRSEVAALEGRVSPDDLSRALALLEAR
ncbi:MAG: Npt1/Npt2 family nucleotide transporter [Kofleriaceae bacterium]